MAMTMADHRGNPFQIFFFTRPAHDDPALAIAACRAGAVGVFNAEIRTDAELIATALAQLARRARAPFGLKLGRRAPHDFGADRVTESAQQGLKWLVVDQQSPL
jgi:hypothetical protein